MTTRGVSTHSDKLFQEIVNMNNDPKFNMQLFEDAKEGKIWDSTIKKNLWNLNVDHHPLVKAILSSKDKIMRMDLLAELANEINHFFPEKGHIYFSILEDLSWKLETGPDESKFLKKVFNVMSLGGKSQDAGLRVLTSILDKTLDWPHHQQWEMVLFLRGEISPSPRIKRIFGPIGPMKIQRIFETLPQTIKMSMLDTIFDDPKGLLNNTNPKKGYGKVMIDHLLGHLDDKTKEIGQDLLEAFIFSLKDTGQSGKQSQVLSYLLALPPSEKNRGEIIKNVLESFGTSGVKIGQFLAAAEVLPEHETNVLRGLQESTGRPERSSIYDDFNKNKKHKHQNIDLQELKGSASMKYVVMGELDDESLPSIYKFLRENAIFNTKVEFEQLKSMANYLRKKGPEYGVFKAIVKASENAVLKELSFTDEVNKSKIAREKIYPKYSDGQFDITVPDERVFGKKFKAEDFEDFRIIQSEFAPGVSLLELDRDQQRKVASKILEMEGDILFSDQAVIAFDPDRHPGNYRIDVPLKGKIRISPIDFGQVISITRIQRDNIIKIFSLGQILRKAGPTIHMTNLIGDFFDLNENKKNELYKMLKDYFPNSKMNELTAHFSILSALDDIGIEVPSQYFDFMKGLAQLNQYEKYVTGVGIETPASKLKKMATGYANEYGEELLADENLTSMEKNKIKLHQYSQKAKNNFECVINKLFP